MKKKLNSHNKLIAIFILLLGTAFLLCGCSTLSYTGEDFDKENVKTINTNEMLTFSTYQKTLPDRNVRAGITKTQLSEVLAIYFEVENKGDRSIYLSQEDVEVYAAGASAELIPPIDFILAYQSSQNEVIAGSQSLASTMYGFANISNNYQNANQNLIMREQLNTEASMKQVSSITNGIRNHTLGNTISSIKPTEKKYYYIFLSEGQYPVEVRYSGLSFTFDNRKKAQ